MYPCHISVTDNTYFQRCETQSAHFTSAEIFLGVDMGTNLLHPTVPYSECDRDLVAVVSGRGECDAVEIVAGQIASAVQCNMQRSCWV